MKWLRSSLFKDNKDTFSFKESINVKIDHYNTLLKEIKDVVVSGVLTRGDKSKIYVDLKIEGNYIMVSARTLKKIAVPFEIIETEEFVDKQYANSEVYETNLLDMYIDLKPLVEELIVLNIPMSSYREEESLELSSGNGWTLMNEVDFIKETSSKKESPFSALEGLFKDK